MKRYPVTAAILAAWLLTGSLTASCAASLVCEGILGNSGEQGETLVRFAPAAASGLGVAYDRFGTLWDRGGDGTLNRYALDGRLLAQYPIAKGTGGWTQNNQLALAGEDVVLGLGGKLYKLPVTAPAGTAPTLLPVEAERLSAAAVEGKVAIARKGELFLLDVATGTTTPAGRYTGSPLWMELGPDLAIYLCLEGKVRKFSDGAEVTTGWPKAAPGERGQLVRGHWYGHAWHGTIKRFTAEMESAPGVVLGGASGSFIGHLIQNSELVNGRGLAQLRDDLFAVSGMGGILHLVAWSPEKRQMTIIRRLGCVPSCRALGLDRQGNVWYQVGNWTWSDGPEAPLINGVNGPEEIGQAVMLESDAMVAPGWLWGKPSFYSGALTGEVAAPRLESGCALARGTIAATAYKNAQGRHVLLTLTKAGKGQAFLISPQGQYQGEAGMVTLKTKMPVAEWTTLAMRDPETLLGAGDGAVVEFARDGADWKETRRWATWGAGERFGGKIFLTADAGRLWIADRERHRVIVFEAKSGAPLATFGYADKAGNDLTALTAPELLAARGDRAVVFDSGNQRLVKLVVRP
jgi:hypothetical protein